jgi:predicted CopG family antitoxin
MDEDELKELYNESKKEALIIFHKKAVGGVSEEYVKELKSKMQQVFNNLKEENERESS